MNCPRCGEKLFGSVCPRCGNVVTQSRTTSSSMGKTRSTAVKSRRNDGNVKFMDSSGSKTVRPSGKKNSGNNKMLKIVIIVLAVICVFLFFRYNSVKSDLKNAEDVINTQNDTINSKDEEIANLKASSNGSSDETGEESSSDVEGEDDSAPSVEFDENGNLINITDNGSSEASDTEKKTEYKSGDTYTIKDGDTGSKICQAIYGKYTPELWEKILSANDMTSSSQYYPGDELKIP